MTGIHQDRETGATPERLLGLPDHFVVRETISGGHSAEHLQPTANSHGCGDRH
jgi:hypothetical protein